MKNIIIRVCLGFLTFFLFYLLGCFYNGTFNTLLWNLDSKMIVCVFGGLFSFAVMSYPDYHFKN